MKCEMLVNAHSVPISAMVLLVDISNMRERSSRLLINHLCGEVLNCRRNSFLNDVSERLVEAASDSSEISLNMLV